MDAAHRRDARLDEAFAAAPRAAFLPERRRGSAHLDQALPIGHGATNSQPSTVRYMLDLLDAQPGQRALDVGSGSGWMYSVNDWYPNYGCSRYTVQPGDVICWVYTCDLGQDVGGGAAVGE